MTMDVRVLGGGPAGLYTALLLKKKDPSRRITVCDRNPAGATYGWGVVFSDETLGFLEDSDYESFRHITDNFVHWENIDIKYQGEVVRSGGHAFSGIARRRLLDILASRCSDVGVDVLHEVDVSDLSGFASADLIVAADGVNSYIRSLNCATYKPVFDIHRTKFIWLGARLPLDAFTFYFRQTDYGIFQVHAYPFEPGISTFIVECTEQTWKSAGLDNASEDESLRFCERLFAEELEGRPLMSNRSTWLNFVTLRNETWHVGNTVLVGDAAHTAHFSVGSGTKMAMEDAIALADALERHVSVAAALVYYEELRRPVVERTQAAARESSVWFEHTARYARFDALQFAFSLLTRSKRITYGNLSLRDPRFSDRVDRWFVHHESKTEPGTARVSPPMLVPLHLRGGRFPNRVVRSVRTETDGPNSEDRLLVEIGGRAREGPGLVMAGPVAVSAEGRITPVDLGIYCDEHKALWKRLVEFVHTQSSALIGLQLNHAGPRGSTESPQTGRDRPLQRGGWPLLAVSPLPYAPFGDCPNEVSPADMEHLCDQFVRAALAALDADIDLLELHFGHGYLVAGFISPLTNRRSDRYGGSIENRLRFPLSILEAVREVWPDDRPLSVCFSLTDWAAGGTDDEDAIAIARALKHAGCDLAHVVTGQTIFNANPAYGRSWEARYSDLIRNEAEIPTMTGGNITTSDDVNTMLAAGRADLCIVDPPYLGQIEAVLPRQTPLDHLQQAVRPR